MQLTSWLAAWKGCLPGAPRGRRGRVAGSAPPSIERLEGRTLPSVVSLGTELPVNSYIDSNQQTYFQTPQAVASDTAGDFVVTWSSFGQDGSGNGIFAQRFDSAGVSQGNEFQVNTFALGNQFGSTVAMDADGDFVIVWTGDAADGSGTGVFAQRFNAAGVRQGREFQVNTSTVGDQQFATVAMDASGDFVVTWSSDDGSGSGIFAQRYNALGAAQGTEFQVNANIANDQLYSSVAMDAGGDFVVAWESDGADGSQFGIFARRFNAAGTALTGDFQVNTTAAGNQTTPSVSMNAQGDFVFAWASDGQDGSGDGVYARRYNAAGAAQGGEFQVNETTDNSQTAPTVALDAAGDFVIAWTGVGQDEDGSSGIFAREYNSSGKTLSGEFRVNTFTTNNQLFSSVSMNAEGDFVAVWSSYGQDGSGYGIYAQRFSGANLPPVNSVPTAQAVTSGSGLVFSAKNGNRISISDPDAGNSTVQVTLTASQGTLTLVSTAGLTFSAGDGTADATMTFRGTLAKINIALNGMRFTPAAGFVGAAGVTVTTDDLGARGTGGAQTDTDTVAITVNQLFTQPPVNSVPGTQAATVNTPLVFSSTLGNGISTSLADAGSSPLQITLISTHGSMTLGTKAGLTFLFGDGTADAVMTFRGTLANLNAALQGLTLTPDAGFHGAASLKITTTNLGSIAAGVAKTDTDTILITVTPAPINKNTQPPAGSPTINSTPAISTPNNSGADPNTTKSGQGPSFPATNGAGNPAPATPPHAPPKTFIKNAKIGNRLFGPH
jgi:hypothetical protein